MNNAILNPNTALVMTSREIAELTSKQHQHVKRDVEKMLAELGEDVSTFGRIYFDALNREQTEYALNRELTETLLTGYSAKLRRAVVARLNELEGRVAAPAFQLPDFTNPATAARAWADAVELAQAKTVQLAIAAPKVAALDRISSADGSMCITNAAKTLKMQPKRLFAWLSECKWIYRRAGGKSWVAYQDRIQSGYLGHDVTVLEKGDGSEKAVTSIFVTAKGLAKLAAEVVA